MLFKAWGAAAYLSNMDQKKWSQVKYAHIWPVISTPRVIRAVDWEMYRFDVVLEEIKFCFQWCNAPIQTEFFKNRLNLKTVQFNAG